MCSFTPTKTGGGKSLSHAEVQGGGEGGGGQKQFWGSFYAVA